MTKPRVKVCEASADCLHEECEWSTVGKNALANASKHHRKTGHAVKVAQHTEILYEGRDET